MLFYAKSHFLIVAKKSILSNWIGAPYLVRCASCWYQKMTLFMKWNIREWQVSWKNSTEKSKKKNIKENFMIYQTWNPLKPVISLCTFSWQESFSDCSKKVNFIKLDSSTIFGRMRFLLISENDSFLKWNVTE